MIAWCCGPAHEYESYMYGVCFRNTWARDKITCTEKDAWAMANMDEIKRLYTPVRIRRFDECLAVGLGGQFTSRQFSLERVS